MSFEQDAWTFVSSPAVKGHAELGLLIFARIAPIIVFTQLFGGQAVPRRYTTGLAIALTIVFTLALSPSHPAPIETGALLMLLCKELLVGGTLAICIATGMEIIGAAGALTDYARGNMMSTLLNPLTEEQTAPLNVFYMQIGLVLFLSLGGLRLVLWALADSFVLLPPTAPMPPGLLADFSVPQVLNFGAGLLLIAFRLAAPVLVMVFAMDVALGLISRVAPQIEVYFLSLPLKSWVGVLIALLGMGLLISTAWAQVGDLFENLIRHFPRAPRIGP